MVKIDGGLRSIFRERLPMLAWTSIESGSTARGVPDSNYLGEGGVEGWIEYKAARGAGMAVGSLKPEQAAWLHRRSRLGGRSWLAVRREDELWLVPGALAPVVRAGGLAEVEAHWRSLGPVAVPVAGLRVPLPQHGGRWSGGPVRWGWPQVLACLRAAPLRPPRGPEPIGEERRAGDRARTARPRL